MKKYCFLVGMFFAFVATNTIIAQEIKPSPIEGRWDLTLNFNGHPADRKSTRLNSSHSQQSRMPSSA